MFLDISRRYDIELTDIPAVGDSLRDLQAASAVGCKPWLVMTGNGRHTLEAGDLPPGTEVRETLAEVVDSLLEI
jgi:D-glycero-D-manno-heptose 1,7-bisphosphate phosphatase